MNKNKEIYKLVFIASLSLYLSACNKEQNTKSNTPVSVDVVSNQEKMIEPSPSVIKEEPQKKNEPKVNKLSPIVEGVKEKEEKNTASEKKNEAPVAKQEKPSGNSSKPIVESKNENKKSEPSETRKTEVLSNENTLKPSPPSRMISDLPPPKAYEKSAEQLSKEQLQKQYNEILTKAHEVQAQYDYTSDENSKLYLALQLYDLSKELNLVMYKMTNAPDYLANATMMSKSADALRKQLNAKK